MGNLAWRIVFWVWYPVMVCTMTLGLSLLMIHRILLKLYIAEYYVCLFLAYCIEFVHNIGLPRGSPYRLGESGSMRAFDDD